MTIIIILATIAGLRALLLASRHKPKKAPVVSVAELERQKKARERAAKEAEKAETRRHKEAAAREKEAAARAQSSEDIPFLENQIEFLTAMIEDAKTAYRIARKRVEYDAEMNEHGAIIKDKLVNQHITERDKAIKKVISLERQIHVAETKLNKARAILDNNR